MLSLTTPLAASSFSATGAPFSVSRKSCGSNIEVPAAMVTLRQIIEQFPDEPQTIPARNRLAMMLTQMNRHAEAAQVLEDMADDVNQTLALPYDVPLLGVQCDEANAFWDPTAKTVTICYEDAATMSAAMRLPSINSMVGGVI